MGYYVEVPTNHDKAQAIVDQFGGSLADRDEAKAAMERGEGVIVVVNNGPFEAAAFAYSPAEWKHFQGDNRPKQYVVMDRALAESISGYRG